MSRVRNLVDYQSQISDLDGDSTRDLNINGTITATAVDSANVPKVDLTIAPEVLEIQVDAPAAGQDTAWLWTWEQSTLPYARRTIVNSPEVNVPLYKQGQYVVNNFAAYDTHANMTQTHSLYFKWIDGAGTDNLVSWATSAGPISDTHPDINGGNATDVQRITVNVPATVTPPTLTAPSVAYTVTNNGAGAYTFSGSAAGDNPNLGPMYRGGTYTFNISATGHPLYLTTDNGTNFSAGTYFGEYTTGVTGSRTDSGTLTITIDANAPDTLYYQCGNHAAMRGAITIKNLAVETNINGNYIIYAMHTQEGHKTPVEIRPIPSLVNQMCIVYDNSVNKFVPQDLATYVENTPSFENKIREVAGTAELVVEDGSAVVAKVNVYDDSTYLPLTGNNPGDQAFATDTDILYIWDGSAWQQAGAANSDDLTEGTTNLFYTDTRVGTYLSGNGYDTATNIIATITDSAPATLDTLNELAAALGDDPNFATTTANNIATKLPLAGGTMTGNIVTGTYGTASTGTGFRFSDSDIYAQTNAQDRIRLNTSGDSWFMGNIGIGTSSPSVDLEVSNSDNSFALVKNTSSGSGLYIKAATNGDAELQTAGGNNEIVIRTSGNERMRFKADGSITANTHSGLATNSSTAYQIYNQVHRWTQNCSATNLDMETSRWSASKSGSVTMRAKMFIKSGSYYFNFKVKNLTDGSYVFNAADGGGFNAYKIAGGNVHASDARYEWTVPNIRAGSQYIVEMSASSSNGQTLYTNTSQDVHLFEFEVMSTDPTFDQYNTLRTRVPYWSSPSNSSGSQNGSAATSVNSYYRHKFNGHHSVLLAHFQFRAYARYMDFRTNLNSNSYMFMMEAHGYFYGAGQMMASRGGYMYSGNSVINQQDCYANGNTDCKFYNFYRDSNGFLCGKLRKNHNSYTEGQLYLYWARFGGNDSGIAITDYTQNNTTSNVF